MNAKVVDLAPHEWCEISTSSEIRQNSGKRDGGGWRLRCVVAVASAGLGFYISTASGERAPAAIASHRTVSIAATHSLISPLRAASRHSTMRDGGRSHAAAAVRAAATESEKTRWEIAGWTVRR